MLRSSPSFFFFSSPLSRVQTGRPFLSKVESGALRPCPAGGRTPARDIPHPRQAQQLNLASLVVQPGRLSLLCYLRFPPTSPPVLPALSLSSQPLRPPPPEHEARSPRLPVGNQDWSGLTWFGKPYLRSVSRFPDSQATSNIPAFFFSPVCLLGYIDFVCAPVSRCARARIGCGFVLSGTKSPAQAGPWGGLWNGRGCGFLRTASSGRGAAAR